MGNGNKKICSFCCNFCCTSVYYSKQVTIKNRSKKNVVIKVEDVKGDENQPLQEKQFHEVESAKVSVGKEPANKLIVTGKKCAGEGKMQVSEEKSENTKTKNDFWKRHNRVNRLMEKHKCSYCEKLSKNVK